MEKHEHVHEEKSKYEVALSKYNTNLNDDEVKAKVAELIEKKVPENNTEEVKKLLFHCIDLTTLNTTDTEEHVMQFTEKVNLFVDKYPDLDNVAAICVYPNMAGIVSDTLEADDVKIAAVSAGFPSSQTFIEVKVAETALAISEGANEIDIVISVGKFLSGDYETMCDEIEELKEVCKDRHMKVILETGALGSKRGKRVLMIDADLRRSSVVSRLRLETEGEMYGLAHYLAGHCELGDCIYETNMYGACIMPAGRDISSPMTLIDTPYFGEMLDHLAPQFDLVLIDTPPVGVVVDAAEIAKRCDGAVLVVNYNATRRRELVEAKRQMEQSGCPIIGCIINKVTFDTLSAKKYYNKAYYSHYYKSGYYGKKNDKD